jgi:hypothetical protein
MHACMYIEKEGETQKGKRKSEWKQEAPSMHTSAYVSIRQHTSMSAHVSIRQHTSAYLRVLSENSLSLSLSVTHSLSRSLSHTLLHKHTMFSIALSYTHTMLSLLSLAYTHTTTHISRRAHARLCVYIYIYICQYESSFKKLMFFFSLVARPLYCSKGLYEKQQ